MITRKHNMRCRKENRSALAIGDVLIIKGEEQNRNFWRLGIVIAKIRLMRSKMSKADLQSSRT